MKKNKYHLQNQLKRLITKRDWAKDKADGNQELINKIQDAVDNPDKYSKEDFDSLLDQVKKNRESKRILHDITTNPDQYSKDQIEKLVDGMKDIVDRKKAEEDPFQKMMGTKAHVDKQMEDITQTLRSGELKDPNAKMTEEQIELAITMNRLGLSDKSSMHEWMMVLLKMRCEKSKEERWVEFEKITSKAHIFIAHPEMFNDNDQNEVMLDPTTERPFFVGNPFDTVFIERLDRKPMCHSKLQSTERGPEDVLDLKIFGILIHQYDEDTYEMLHLVESEGNPMNLSIIPCSVTRNNYMSNTGDEWETDSMMHNLTFNVMSLITKGVQMGQEKVNRKARMSRGNDRQTYRIKNIVHVRKKQRVSVPTPGLTTDINWSHRWEVMGHWRKVSGLGKDERGIYGLRGLTWVKPHTKGPDEKELVKKIRLVGESKDGR